MLRPEWKITKLVVLLILRAPLVVTVKTSLEATNTVKASLELKTEVAISTGR
jgi:hypothetical protein